MGAIEAQSFTERRDALTDEIGGLMRARGAAVLDGKPFDADRLYEARSELAALDAAEEEAVRRSRAAQDAQRAAERAEARAALGKDLDRYLKAVERAESACRAMIAELKQADELAGAMRVHVRTIGGGLPICLEPSEVLSRHTAMLATSLAPVVGLAWNAGIKIEAHLPIEDWTAHARNVVTSATQPIIEGNNHV
jgi:cytochrome c556